jgi:hypothetical protein
MANNMQAQARELIEQAIERHGGMARYQQIDRIVCDVTTMGGLAMRRRGLHYDFPLPNRVTLMPRQNQAVLHDYPAPGSSCLYDNGRVAQVGGGREARFDSDNHRRQMLAVSRLRRPWSVLDAVYFFGYAMTHYASLPFSLPGLKVVGLARRRSGDWHTRIDVEYPDGAHTTARSRPFISMAAACWCAMTTVQK